MLKLNDGAPLLSNAGPGRETPIARNFDRWGQLGTYLWPNCFFGTGTCPSSPLPNRARPDSYDDYVFIMKDFIEDRAAWIDRQFRSPPVITSTSAAGETAVEVSIEPTSSGTLYYTIDGSDPRDPTTGRLAATAIQYQEPFTVDQNVIVQARTRSSSRWSAKGFETYIVQTPKVTISELNYNPADSTALESAAGFGDNDDFEFFELVNFGSDPVDVGGWRVEGGIEVTLDDAVIAPGERVVVVRNTDAFQTRYGDQPVIVGQYGDPTNEALDFKLRNSGERLALVGNLQEIIVDFTYSDDWFSLTDGDGFSLVRREPIDAADDLNTLAAWRPSELHLGSPGQAEAGVVPNPGTIVISEIIDQATGAVSDRVELANTTDSPIGIGNFLITHAADQAIQYRVPADVEIPPRGFVVLDQNQLGPNFQLSPLAGSLRLQGSLADGTLTGFQESVDFGTSTVDRSWGRVETSVGSDFVLQQAVTAGAANAGPVIGPVVISEIQYHPADGGREFIELRNITTERVSIENWEFDGGLQFRFPTTEIAADGHVVLIQGDQANDTAAIDAFRQNHQVPDDIPILVYTDAQHGSLNNGGETLTLKRPLPGTSLMLEVDRITYSDEAPWYPRADGLGPSLSRINGNAFGNDPANWLTSTQAGTPGRDNIFEDPTPPTTPQSLAGSVLLDGNVALGWLPSVDADSRVEHYAIYRDNRQIGTSPIPFFRDAVRWTEGAELSYQVTAVNSDGFESPASVSVEVAIGSSSFQQGVRGYTGNSDTAIRESQPEANFADSRRIGVGGNDPGETGSASSALLRWTDLDVPTESRLVGATIDLNVVNSGDPFAIRPLNKPWSEAEVSWLQAANGSPWQSPGAQGEQDAGEAIGEFATPTRGWNTVRLDAAGIAVVQSWINAPETNHGVIMDDPGNSTDSITFNAAQSTTTQNRPKLTLFHTTQTQNRAGDFNFDNQLNAHDIDALHASIHKGVEDPIFDVDGNSVVDQADVDFLLENLLSTTSGDANLDGLVNFADFLLLSAAFGKPQPQSWSTGDFNGDGQSSFADFLVLSANYGKGKPNA